MFIKNIFQNKKFYFHQFLYILLLSMIGNIFLIFLSNNIHELPITLSILSFIIFSLFYGLLAWVGIKLSIKANLNSFKHHKFIKTTLVPALIGSVIALVLIFLLNRIIIKIPVEDMTFLDFSPLWIRLISSFHDGLNSEILFRLFLLSFFYLLLKKIKYKPFQKKSVQTFFIWISILCAAITPLALNFITLDNLTIIRLTILYLVGGSFYGYLYIYKSFWAATIAHFIVEFFLNGI